MSILIDILFFLLLISINIILFVLSFRLEKRINNIETLITTYNLFKDDTNNNQSIPIKNNPIDNLVTGLDKIRKDDDNYLNMLNLARQKAIYTSNGQETINSDNNLIPANLTKEEITILNLFYSKDNDNK